MANKFFQKTETHPFGVMVQYEAKKFPKKCRLKKTCIQNPAEHLRWRCTKTTFFQKFNLIFFPAHDDPRVGMGGLEN